MATFQNLKNDRNVRLASTSSNPTQLEITALISTPLLPLPLENQNQETFSDLNGLKVHQSDSRLGRTLHSDKNYVGGRVLMTTTPLVSVLDNKNIKNYCFTCHKEGELTRCSGCKFIYYCSPICQKLDWQSHKLECKDLQKYKELPSTPVRTLGRLLRAFISFPETKKQFDTLESHAIRLLPETKETYAQILLSLTKFVGQNLITSVFKSSLETLDFISRFSSNSFGLSDVSLCAIGVCISSTMAIPNHSCNPNSIFIFPNRPSITSPHSITTSLEISNSPTVYKFMKLTSLKPIAIGEEITISYVDLLISGEDRRLELSSTYYFDCQCELCISTLIDPRNSIQCLDENCHGLGYNLDLETGVGEVDVQCECGKLSRIDAGELKRSMEKAKLDRAKLSNVATLCFIASLEKSLISRVSYANPFILQTNREIVLNLLPSNSNQPPSVVQARLRQAFVYSGKVCLGMEKLLPFGHPVRAVALSLRAKLFGHSFEAHLCRTAVGEKFKIQILKRKEWIDVLNHAISHIEFGFGIDSWMKKEMKAILDGVQSEVFGMETELHNRAA